MFRVFTQKYFCFLVTWLELAFSLLLQCPTHYPTHNQISDDLAKHMTQVLVWWVRSSTCRLPMLTMGLLPDTQNCGCACAGNAGNVFPVTAGKRSRHASRHVRHARAVMHAGIANYRFPLISTAGENVPGIPGACATCNFTYLVRGPWQLHDPYKQHLRKWWHGDVTYDTSALSSTFHPNSSILSFNLNYCYLKVISKWFRRLSRTLNISGSF